MNEPQVLRRIPFTLCAVLLLCPLLAPSRLTAEERGPSTAEERAKVIEITHKLESDPLNPQADEWRVWLAKWIDEVPDVVVPIRTAADVPPVNLPTADDPAAASPNGDKAHAASASE